MIMEISETIKVGAVFSAEGGKGIRKVHPKWFVWEGRKYTIKEVNYTWKELQGSEDLYCFSVTDGANNYELSFNSKRVVWVLNKVF
jgi:hypothetical protein